MGLDESRVVKLKRIKLDWPLYNVFIYNNNIKEGFLTDAQLNNIFFMDPYYVAYDGMYDPNRLMTKPLVMGDDKVTGVLDETIDSSSFNDNIKYNYVQPCDALTTADKKKIKMPTVKKYTFNSFLSFPILRIVQHII